jgi:DNA invertase Pin-like site-specific DNA recombinase
VKVVGYIRVSTDKQEEQGFGLDVQERTIKQWAKEHGHKIAKVIADEGVSGTLEDRDGLAEAIDLLRTGKVQGLVVPRLDRLARDLILQETILRDTRPLGEVFTCSPAEAGFLNDDPDDPSRKLIRQILGSVAEWERAMVVLRLRGGRRRKAARGGFAYGSPAYGTRAEAKELVADEDEQAALARIKELRTEGHSLRSIGEALTREGYRPKRSARWHTESLRRIIAREQVRS